MSLIVVGTNHKYSPITLREKLAFSKKRLRDALNLLREREVFKGAVILSTCNRVEIYASVEGPTKEGIREIEGFISRYHEIDRGRLTPYLYIYKGREAMRHLVSVASGLDSLILGETQILGQVKSSFLESESVGFIDEFLKEIFYSAISSAKRIHEETKISEGKISIGSVAIDFIKEKIGVLSGKNILIIGVGKVTELVLKYFSPPPKADAPQAQEAKKERPNVVFISNRTFEKAKELAARIGAKAVKFDALKQFLKKADVVITATASPHFIIRKETLEEDISRRLLIIDLALPRDVEPRAKEIKNVDLFCLEDLDPVIKKNIERKSQEAKKAKGIIDVEVEKIWAEFTELEQEPALLP